jgi:hypothetical protein
MIPIVVIFLAVLFLFIAKAKSNTVTQMNETPTCCCNITNDPTTWPSGDRIWLICHAVGYAEGANVAGSLPDRSNNPGDISDYFDLYGGVVCGSHVTQFPSKQIGWQKLYEKWSNILAGNSTSYDPNTSWNTIAQTWAGDWKNWVTNLTNKLGVDPNSTPADYMAS